MQKPQLSQKGDIWEIDCFLWVILQHDNMIKKGSDIFQLLKHRMDACRQDHFDEMVSEFERCVTQRQRPR